MYATLIVLVTIRLTSLAPLTLETCNCVWLQIFKNTQLFLNTFFYGTANQVGLWPLPFEVSGSHTIRHTHTRWDSSERVISPSQRALPHNTINTTDEHSCPPAGFEPEIPTVKRPYALNRTATGIGHCII